MLLCYSLVNIISFETANPIQQTVKNDWLVLCPPLINTGLESLTIRDNYEGWNFNSGNYLFTTDTK